MGIRSKNAIEFCLV